MKIKNIIYYGLLILLIVLAVFPRITEVVNKNYVFGFDQGRDYLDVQKIVDQHKLTLIGTEIGAGDAGFKFIFHGPGYYYLLTLPYILFKGDPYGSVVLMFIFGIASVTLAYFAGRKIFGKWGGIIMGLLTAVSPPLLSQSRFIWNSFPATFFIILEFYLIYKSINNRKALYSAAFTGAFIYNFELAMAIPLVSAVLFFGIFILKIRKFKDYLILLFSIFLGFLPMFLFEARHGFEGLRSILGYIFTSHPKTQPFYTQFINRQHISAFLYNFRDGFPHLPATGWEIGLFVLLLASLILILKKEKSPQIKKMIFYLLSLPLITYTVLSFLRNSVWPHYLNHLLIAYMFIFTYAIIRIWERKIFLKYFLLGFLGFFLISGMQTANAIFNQDYPNYYGGTAKIKGKTDALDYIYKDAKGEKFSLFVFAPPIYTYPFDYLRVWYGRKKYGFKPGFEKKGLFYLIIEKDGERPTADKGWKETVIKTGKVLWTKTLPSKFIIEKRYQD